MENTLHNSSHPGKLTIAEAEGWQHSFSFSSLLPLRFNSQVESKVGKRSAITKENKKYLGHLGRGKENNQQRNEHRAGKGERIQKQTSVIKQVLQNSEWSLLGHLPVPSQALSPCGSMKARLWKLPVHRKRAWGRRA